MVLVLTTVHLKEIIVKFYCEIKVTIRNNTTRKRIKLLRIGHNKDARLNSNLYATKLKG